MKTTETKKFYADTAEALEAKFQNELKPNGWRQSEFFTYGFSWRHFCFMWSFQCERTVIED